VTPDVRAPDRFVAVGIFSPATPARPLILCHKTAIERRHEIEIIGRTAGEAMPDTNIDFGLLAGAGAPARSFKAGEIIFKEGDPADELFVVKTGSVEIRLGNRLLDTLPERSIFGEMALIDHGPRSATAVAATDTELVPVGEKQFLFLVSRTPYFAINVMRVLVQRLRRTSNTVIY
jgi:CRP/FNR family cyclic AMP-dependent transcriptional regulator